MPRILISDQLEAPGLDLLRQAGMELDERDALWLFVNKGMSHREIAAATSSPIGTVKTRLRRAVMRLQSALGVSRAASADAIAPSLEESA